LGKGSSESGDKESLIQFTSLAEINQGLVESYTYLEAVPKGRRREM
jgi:hypothetical protein